MDHINIIFKRKISNLWHLQNYLIQIFNYFCFADGLKREKHSIEDAIKATGLIIMRVIRK